MAGKKYQIRLLKIAEDDFKEIITYIAADNPKAAQSLANKIESNLELLSANPQLGRVPRDNDIKEMGYRYLIVHNYIIFYTIEKKTIYIHRILHGARNYKTIL